MKVPAILAECRHQGELNLSVCALTSPRHEEGEIVRLPEFTLK